MNRNRNNSAFTLIEMLVALALIGLVVSMVYGSYAATSGSLEVYDSRLSCSQRAQLALRLMTRQVRCVYAPTEPNDRESAPIFRADVQGGREEVLTLLTTAGLGGSPTTPQQLACVRYRFDRAAGTLSIRQGFEADEDAAGRWHLLLDRVERIDLAFHDGRQWQPQWDYAQEEELPRAVRIEITVIAEDGRRYSLATTASVGYRVAAARQLEEAAWEKQR